MKKRPSWHKIKVRRLHDRTDGKSKDPAVSLGEIEVLGVGWGGVPGEGIVGKGRKGNSSGFNPWTYGRISCRGIPNLKKSDNHMMSV